MRPAIYTGGGSSVKGGKPSASRDVQHHAPRRVVDMRFGQVLLISWRGRLYLEVM